MGECVGEGRGEGGGVGVGGGVGEGEGVGRGEGVMVAVLGATASAWAGASASASASAGVGGGVRSLAGGGVRSLAGTHFRAWTDAGARRENWAFVGAPLSLAARSRSREWGFPHLDADSGRALGLVNKPHHPRVTVIDA